VRFMKREGIEPSVSVLIKEVPSKKEEQHESRIKKLMMDSSIKDEQLKDKKKIELENKIAKNKL